MARCIHLRPTSDHEAPYEKRDVQIIEVKLQFSPHTTVRFEVNKRPDDYRYVEMAATSGAENLKGELWVKDKRGRKMTDANRKFVEVGRPCRIPPPLNGDRLCWSVWEKCAICERPNGAGNAAAAVQKRPSKPSLMQARVQEAQPTSSKAPTRSPLRERKLPPQPVQRASNVAELDALKAKNALLHAKVAELERRNADDTRAGGGLLAAVASKHWAMREAGEHTNFRLLVDRLVLAGRSDFFAAFFRAHPTKTELSLAGIPHHVALRLLEFLYGVRVDGLTDDLRELFAVGR
ncbi:hypothetical protein M3Y99_00661600 [Aphelenchoides fujianensis]|nr:hypothetical protein M3Y99_00661600 [Aphelenchoides fujianensis]